MRRSSNCKSSETIILIKNFGDFKVNKIYITLLVNHAIARCNISMNYIFRVETFNSQY
jgi:hypothetical protein